MLKCGEESQRPRLVSQSWHEVTVNISINVTVSPATTSARLYPPCWSPSRHQFYELGAHMWPLMDGGLCLSVCLRVAAWLGGWKRCSWFPRSQSALFCANIWKYFMSICGELSPQAACLTFCISVAVRVVKWRENEMQSNSGSWIKLWKTVYIE